MAINTDILEIDLALEKDKKSNEVPLFIRLQGWIECADLDSFNYLLDRLKLPINLQDAAKVSKILNSLKNKDDLTPAEMIVLGFTYDSWIGLPLSAYLMHLYFAHKSGLAVTQLDNVKAAMYFKAAAKEGFVPAIFILGVNYFNGNGIFEKDVDQAITLLEKAAEQNFTPALIYLAYLQSTELCYIDISKAVLYYKTAALQGNRLAWFNLGIMQLNGYSASIELPTPVECFVSAAKLGCENALRWLIAIYKNGIGIKQDSHIADDYLEIYLKHSDINQNLLIDLMNLFLSQITFVENGELKSESLPEGADEGLCNGFVLMLLRASLIGQQEKHLRRLRLLSRMDNESLKKMGKLFSDYKSEFQNYSLLCRNELDKKLKACVDNIQAAIVRKAHYERLEEQILINLQLDEEQKELLSAAKELYAFISSLMFAQDPGKITHRLFDKYILQDNTVDILRIILPDELILDSTENTLSSVQCVPIIPINQTVRIPINMVFDFCFNFLLHELAETIKICVFPSDYVKIRSTNHAMYFQRHNDNFIFYDPTTRLQKIVNHEELAINIKYYFYTIHNYADVYLPVHIQIFARNQSTLPKPTASELLEIIFKQRGSNNQINAQAWNGATALSFSIKCLNKAVVKDLLIRGADLNLAICNEDIIKVVLAGHFNIIEMLARKNIDLNQTESDGNSLAHHAARLGDHHTIEILGRYNANLNLTNIHGFTPVYLAILIGKHNVVEVMAKYNVDLNQVDKYGKKLVYLAISLGKHNVVEVLAKYKVDLNQVDQYGQTPAHWSMMYSDNHETIKILAKFNANFTKLDKLGNSPLYGALISNKMKNVIVFLSAMKSNFLFSDKEVDQLNKDRYKLLSEFFQYVEKINDDHEKLKLLDSMLEPDKNKRNALCQFFHSPTNTLFFLFSSKNMTGCVLKIEEYREKLLTKMKKNQQIGQGSINAILCEYELDITTNSFSLKK